MHCLPLLRKIQKPGKVRAKVCSPLFVARFLLPMMLCLAFAFPVFCQDAGSEEKEFYGNGCVISVTVHDSSGGPIPSPATVKLYRGTIPSGQQQTSRGIAELVVTSLGEFTVIVAAPGYDETQKEVSVRIAGRAQVDVYLRRPSVGGSTAGALGRPVLTPKAKEALNKGLLALSADKTGEAEKHVNEAIRLAPGHPDVLYVQGVLGLKQRKWTQAQMALEKATQIDPSHAQAFAALGMALCDQGKYDAAIMPLEKSLQLSVSGAWETRWALAKAYYQHEQYDEALKMSQSALTESNGKAPEIELLVAQSLTAVGRYEDAAQILRGFLKEHGDRREAPTVRHWLERLTNSGRIRTN